MRADFKVVLDACVLDACVLDACVLDACVLDACVLANYGVANVLFLLAEKPRLYRPLWSVDKLTRDRSATGPHAGQPTHPPGLYQGERRVKTS